MKRITAKLLVLVMVLTMLPTIVLGESFSDMPKDWSSEALSKAVENGLLTGYNGKLMPEASLTRAQMAAIINRAFGSYASGSIDSYIDVPESKWYRNDMAKAVQMKTFVGSGNMLNPESNITREEAFIVMARAMKLEPSGSMPAGFSDLDEISVWAKGEVFALINAGYVKGSNGLINPKGSITRAEFAQLMHNMIKNYIRSAGEYSEDYTGNVMVSVPGVVLKNMSIKGDLIAGEGIGDGSLILDNVNIEGRLVVRGGGINSIIIKNSSSIGESVIISRYDGAVRVFLEDGTEAEAIYIEDGNDKVIIEGSLETLVINTDIPVELVDAKVGEIKVYAPGAEVSVDKDSKIDSVLVYKEAEGSTITVNGKVVSIVTAASETTIKGKGTVEIIEVMSTGSKSIIDVEADKIVVDSNAKDVTLPEEPVTGGGGGAPYVSPRLTSASLNGTEAVISGDSINVPFSFNDEHSYTISAQFNKAVRIKSVSVDNWDLIQPNVDVPTAYSNPVEAIIEHPITLDHFVKFGNDVTVVVTDGTTDLVFNITLNVPGYN
ncbi:S-layer homology domain-containing protein [Gudongella oleilytica]|uniref:S-layer homology domain-containing protein n=1 Tax=Gudongella oleilytica TaxID=1582259 RepID=UPI0013E8E9DE|nr:S-layer homology domain-containing protein [Gudongella oleilytica]